MSFRKISAAILAVIMCFSVHLGCAIEEGAFDGCGSVNVHSAADSPAAEYCRTHTNCTLIAQ